MRIVNKFKFFRFVLITFLSVIIVIAWLLHSFSPSVEGADVVAKPEMIPEEEIIEEVTEEDEPQLIEEIEKLELNSGEFTVTYYCGCSKCCGKYSSGSELDAYGCKGDKLTPMYSIAADPKVIPYGTIVHDNNGNEYIVQDVGGGIKGYHIDIFTGSHQKALELGRGTKVLNW